MPKYETSTLQDVVLKGSNVEGTPNAAAPSKAIYIAGVSGAGDGSIKTPSVFNYGGGDGQAPGNQLAVWSIMTGYNESTFDRWRGNTQGTLLASAARTAIASSSNQTNYNAKGVILYLNVTVASGTGGLTVTLRSIDPISGQTVVHNVSPTAIIATGIYAYELYPGATTAGTAGSNSVNQRTAAALPRTWYSAVIHGDATSYTYSVGYSLIL